MKKLKGILGIVLTACMLLSCFSIGMSVSAADVSTEKTGQPASLQQNVEDGVILHALCWGYKEIEKNIPAIAAAGYTAVQTSPVQQPKDMNTSTNVSGQWWKLYQPVSLSIAKNSWVGTEADLKSLCTTAHKYNVKIICDIVSNHLGSGLVNDQDDPHVLAEDVKKYEPTLYNSNGKVVNNPYFHQDFTNAGDGNNCTTGLVTGCPDLNSSNSTVQSRVAALLKQCVNCGVDGFRFDAAKHIETTTGFWTKIISEANTAAGSKKLFYYGEVLNQVGGGRNMSTYTSLNGGKFRVTDNKQSSAIRNGVTGHNAGSAASATYGLSGGASHAVLWAESHDTYLGNNESGEVTTGVSDSDIIKSWALVAARKDATALFFARTNSMKMGASAKNTSYKDVAVAEVNKFHNNFVGQSEKSGSSGSIAYVARGGKGIVLVNVNGNSTKASVSGTGLSDGKYKDMVTGAEFTVSGGTVSGQIGSSGVAVVMQSETTPMAFADVESGTFSGDTLTVGLRLSNATSGTYQLENYAATKFTGTPKIKIGSDYKYGETINLKLTATDGKQTTESVYQYTKVEAASSGVYILIPASAVKSASWNTPIYCYLYDQVSGEGGKVGGLVYKNAAWPGEMLEFDEKLNCYYLEVGDKTAIAEKTLAVDRSGNVTKSEAAGVKTFDLAHSKNTHVILSDSSKSAGGVSQGKQFPSSSSKKTLDLGGSSKKLTQLSGSPSASIFQNTTDVPGQQAPVAATEVKKGGAPATEPTTVTESSTEGTTVPPSGLIYGDADLDGRVSVKDATQIQKHAAALTKLTGNALAVSDVNGDNNVNVKDATCIQCFIANLPNTGKTNQPFNGSVSPATAAPTASAAPKPTTEAPTEPEPETDPEPVGDNYTVYVKTKLSWLSSQLTEPYLYDNSTGESYLLERDTSAPPYVFTAEVPASFSDATFYRAKGPADPADGEAGGVYNIITGLDFSEDNNCYTLEKFPDGGEAVGSMGKYVAEEAGEDTSITTLYVKDDAGWGSVYFYGWGEFDDSDTLAGSKVSGQSNVWKFELPVPLVPGSETFLLKATAGKKDWNKKTENLALEEGMNMYSLKSGTWSKFNG